MAGRRTEMNLEGFFFLIALLTPVHCIGEDLHLPFLSQENLLPPLLTDAQLQDYEEEDLGLIPIIIYNSILLNCLLLSFCTLTLDI